MKKKSVFNTEESMLNSWYNLRKGFEYFYKTNGKDLHINPAEAMFLSRIYYKDGVSQREIANDLIVSEANITKTFKKLEGKGLVHKTIDKSNNARRNLHLTEEGEKTFEKVIKIFDDFDKVILEGFEGDELETIEKTLQLVGNKAISIIKQ